MRWEVTKRESGYEYELIKPEPLDFWDTYILMSCISIVVLLGLVIVWG